MSLRSQWQQFKQSRPGHRFQDFYEKRQQNRQGQFSWKPILNVGLGLVISVGGVLLLGLPGPGLLVVAIGLALVSSESSLMARGLDQLELYFRQRMTQFIRWWSQLTAYQRRLGLVTGVILLSVTAGCIYVILK